MLVQPHWRTRRDPLTAGALLLYRALMLLVSMIGAVGLGLLNATLALLNVAFWLALGIALCMVLLRGNWRIWPFH